MVEITDIFVGENNPKILFEYCLAIEKYLGGNKYKSFGQCVEKEQFNLSVDKERFQRIDNLKLDNQREGETKVNKNKISEILQPLKNSIISLIEKNKLFKDLVLNSQNKKLSEILKYGELFSFSEDIAIYLFLKKISKNQFYDILSLFKTPTISSILRENTDLIRPLFIINLTSIRKVDQGVMLFFDSLSKSIKTPEDYYFAKVFIDSVYVYLYSYYGGKE